MRNIFRALLIWSSAVLFDIPNISAIFPLSFPSKRLRINISRQRGGNFCIPFSISSVNSGSVNSQLLYSSVYPFIGRAPCFSFILTCFKWLIALFFKEAKKYDFKEDVISIFELSVHNLTKKSCTRSSATSGSFTHLLAYAQSPE